MPPATRSCAPARSPSTSATARSSRSRRSAPRYPARPRGSSAGSPPACRASGRRSHARSSTTSAPARCSPSSTATPSGCARCAPRPVAPSRARASSARSRPGGRWRRSARSRRSCSRTASPPGWTAGRIARSLGIELDDPQRLRAGLRFALEESEADGNTFLPLDELWQRAGKLLEIGEVEALESAVRVLVAEAEAVVEGDRIYRTELWEMERRLAAALAERARTAAVELFDAHDRPAMEVSD